MRLARHVGTMLWEALRMALATRRISLVVAIIAGLLLIAVVFAVQVAAPIAIYPFA